MIITHQCFAGNKLDKLNVYWQWESSVIVFIALQRMCYPAPAQSHSYCVVSYLFVLNSACNFFIYNLVGGKFRKCLLEIVEPAVFVMKTSLSRSAPSSLKNNQSSDH